MKRKMRPIKICSNTLVHDREIETFLCSSMNRIKIKMRKL